MEKVRHSSRPTIAFLGANTNTPICRSLWPGLLDAAAAHDVNLLYVAGESLAHPVDFKHQANVLYDLVLAEHVDGVALWTSVLDTFVGRDAFQAFLGRYSTVPVVSLGEIVTGIPSLIMDNYQGMYAAVTHLIEAHGCRRLAFVRGPEDHYYAQERYRAYTDALTAHGIALDARLITPPYPLWDASHGDQAIRVLLDERGLRPQADFEAIVVANDTLALAALNALQSRGLRVPNDLAITGFNDQPESQFTTPPLTSVTAPFYELGERTIATLTALIRGEHVPEQIVIPSQLIARQSCGCASPIVVQAAAMPVVEANEPLLLVLETQRREILTGMMTALKGMKQATVWVEQCLNALADEVAHGMKGVFLVALHNGLQQTAETGGDVKLWHEALSVLRQQALSGLMTPETRQHAEDLWQQARILISEMVERIQGRQYLQTEQQAKVVRDIGMELITTFDVPNVMQILARRLPTIGIPGCAIALYEQPDAPLKGVRLRLAYTPQGQVELPAEGQLIPATAQWIAQTVASEDRRMPQILEDLYFQTIQIGVIIFEAGPRDGAIYEILGREISSALQGALLVQHVQERSAELARQHYVLDTFMTNVPDSIYFKDPEGRFTRVNHALAQFFGLNDPLSLIGKTDFDFFPQATAQSKYEQEQQIMRSGEPVVNLEEPDANGRWVLTTKMPLRDEHGNVIGTFGISRDITNLKHMQADLRRAYAEMEQRVAERTGELRQLNEYLQQEIQEHRKTEVSLQVSEQQYRLLADQMAEGLVIIRERMPVFVNTAFAVLVEDSPEHILQKEFAAWFPPAVRTFVAERLTVRDTETPVSRWQTELIGGGERLLWIEIEQRPIVWDNQPAQLLTVRNITEQKLRETHLEQERARLQQENLTLKSTIHDRFRFGALVGKSQAMQRVYELIISAATSDVNALLVGESGTGKELIARTIHQVSARKSQVFVPVNCASIPESLFEREFFGHRKGSFTGADRDQPGLFDRAHQGTLFLDEVTELSPGMQAKLLRVLQDGEYLPLGATSPKQADVLIVAATNKAYHALVQQKLLREDFFYRICVIEIQVPPLRERKEDIPLLIEHFLNLHSHKQQQREPDGNSALPILPGQILETLYAYDWPGNIRELSNVLQRYLATQHLDEALPLIAAPDARRGIPEQFVQPLPANLSDAVKAFEKQIIATALDRHQQNVSQTAASLGVPFSTLYRKAKQHQLL